MFDAVNAAEFAWYWPKVILTNVYILQTYTHVLFSADLGFAITTGCAGKVITATTVCVKLSGMAALVENLSLQ